MKGHNESSAGKAQNSIGNRTHFPQILWVGEKVVDAVFCTKSSHDHREHEQP